MSVTIIIVYLFASIDIVMMPITIFIALVLIFNITGFPYIINAVFSYDIRQFLRLNDNPWPVVIWRRIPVIVIAYVIDFVVVDYVIRSSNGN